MSIKEKILQGNSLLIIHSTYWLSLGLSMTYCQNQHLIGRIDKGMLDEKIQMDILLKDSLSTFLFVAGLGFIAGIIESKPWGKGSFFNPPFISSTELPISFSAMMLTFLFFASIAASEILKHGLAYDFFIFSCNIITLVIIVGGGAMLGRFSGRKWWKYKGGAENGAENVSGTN